MSTNDYIYIFLVILFIFVSVIYNLIIYIVDYYEARKRNKIVIVIGDTNDWHNRFRR